MSAVDEIQAAIEKLTVTSTEIAAVKAGGAWDAMLHNANLAERMWYATIDAQLAILRNEAWEIENHNRPPYDDILNLARAINGATS